VGREKDQRVGPGIGFDIGIGLFCEAPAGKVCGIMLLHKLSLIIADIPGEEQLNFIGTKKNGAMAVCVTGSMHQGDVAIAGEPAGLLKRRQGLVEIEKRRFPSVGIEGAPRVFPFLPVHQYGCIGESGQAARVIEVQMGEDDRRRLGKVHLIELPIYLLIRSDVEPELGAIEPVSYRAGRAEIAGFGDGSVHTGIDEKDSLRMFDDGCPDRQPFGKAAVDQDIDHGCGPPETRRAHPGLIRDPTGGKKMDTYGPAAAV
jgi:hypothetical protein